MGDRLRSATGVEAWSFSQANREAVFIPAGCPHQVCNTRACLKVALDFVAPESASQCLRLAHEFTYGHEEGFYKEDKLQGELSVLRGAAHLAEVVKAVDGGQCVPHPAYSAVYHEHADRPQKKA